MDRFSYSTKKLRRPAAYADEADGLYAFQAMVTELQVGTSVKSLPTVAFADSLQKHLKSPTLTVDALEFSYFRQDGAYPETVALDIAGYTGENLGEFHITSLVLAKTALSEKIRQFTIYRPYDIDTYDAILAEQDSYDLPLSATTTPQTIAADPDIFAHPWLDDDTNAIKKPMTYRHHKLLATIMNAQILASQHHS